ncbi:hypothetical protein FXW26_00065 [Candidatus Liberibacter asiaticus]|nr:hypothetical protein FXW26_00065 [Candidatus Liberibacter asiaticus]
MYVIPANPCVLIVAVVEGYKGVSGRIKAFASE